MYRNSASSIGSFELIPPSHAPITPFAFQYARNSAASHGSSTSSISSTHQGLSTSDRILHPSSLGWSSMTPSGTMEIDSPMLMMMFSPSATTTSSSSSSNSKANNELPSGSSFQWPRTFSDHEWANLPRFSDADSLPTVSTPVPFADGSNSTGPLTLYPTAASFHHQQQQQQHQNLTSSALQGATGTMTMMMSVGGNTTLPALGYASEESPSTSDTEEAMLLSSGDASTYHRNLAAAAALTAVNASNLPFEGPSSAGTANRKRSITSSLTNAATAAVSSAASSFSAALASSLKRGNVVPPLASATYSGEHHAANKRLRRKKHNVEFVEDFSSNEDEEAASRGTNRRRRAQSPPQSSQQPPSRRRALGGRGSLSPSVPPFAASTSTTPTPTTMINKTATRRPQAAEDVEEENNNGEEGEDDDEFNAAMLLTSFGPSDMALISRQSSEETEEAKARAWPRIWETAVRAATASGACDEASAVVALLSAFTENGKVGREIPSACVDLLTRATECVAAARKEQRGKQSSLFASSGDAPQSSSSFRPEVDAQGKYPCGRCEKIYSTSEGLRLHNRNHHDIDKKWVCAAPQCEGERRKSFARQADLKMHVIRVHSPVRPFPCRLEGCTKSFACFSELRRHLANLHGDVVRDLLGALEGEMM